MTLFDERVRAAKDAKRANGAHPVIAHTRPPINGNADPYAVNALASEAARIAALTEGTRNDDLNRAAYRMGQLVGAGLIDIETVRGQLTDAAHHAGLPDTEIRKVLRDDTTSGLQGGIANPRHIEPSGRHDPVVKLITAEPAPAEHTSWWPVPLTDAANGSDQKPEPTHLVRDDGQPLMYSGQVNGLIGESESGKSWIALLAIIQAVGHGQTVLMLDFEDSPASIHQRMVDLGLHDAELTGFHYANPDETLGTAQQDDLAEALARRYAVIVVDGVNAAMTLLGFDLNSNTDATLFTRKILRPLAATGACVITVDHVPKNVEQRGKGGIGAQAKRAMLDGCALGVETVEPFGKGQDGIINLNIDKDRHGRVRGNSLNGRLAGQVRIESLGDQIRMRIQPAHFGDGQNKPWEPTVKMAEIAKTLADLGKPLSFRQIKQLVTGRDETLRTAVAALVRSGHVKVQTGTRGAIMHVLIRPYPGEDTDGGGPVPADHDELSTGPERTF